MLKPKKPRDQKVHCGHHLQGGCRRGDKCNFYHKGENEEVGDCPDYLEGKCAFGEQCMKGHHDDESKLAVQTPPQEMHSQHLESDAVLDNSVEHLDELEDKDKEEGAASGEEKDPTTRDIVVAIMKVNAELERNMAKLRNKWLPPR